MLEQFNKVISTVLQFFTFQTKDEDPNDGILIDMGTETIYIIKNDGSTQERKLLKYSGGGLPTEQVVQVIKSITRASGGAKEIEYDCMLGKFIIQTESGDWRQVTANIPGQ